MKAQARWEVMDRTDVFYTGVALIVLGTLLVVSSFLALGFTGTFLGRYKQLGWHWKRTILRKLHSELDGLSHEPVILIHMRTVSLVLGEKMGKDKPTRAVSNEDIQVHEDTWTNLLPSSHSHLYGLRTFVLSLPLWHTNVFASVSLTNMFSVVALLSTCRHRFEPRRVWHRHYDELASSGF